MLLPLPRNEASWPTGTLRHPALVQIGICGGIRQSRSHSMTATQSFVGLVKSKSLSFPPRVLVSMLGIRARVANYAQPVAELAEGVSTRTELQYLHDAHGKRVAKLYVVEIKSALEKMLPQWHTRTWRSKTGGWLRACMSSWLRILATHLGYNTAKLQLGPVFLFSSTDRTITITFSKPDLESYHPPSTGQLKPCASARQPSTVQNSCRFHKFWSSAAELSNCAVNYGAVG